MKTTIRAFDVDFSPCECRGTLHKTTRLQVIAVRWKRTDKRPSGRVRFQCMRCKHSWSMNNIKPMGTGIILDAGHPEEIIRRNKISDDYDTKIAVNLGGPSQSPGGFPGGEVNLIGGIRKGARNPHA